MFALLDVVRLKKADSDTGATPGNTGTIVDVLADGVYTVEFFDEDHDTIMESLDKYYREDELMLVAQGG